MVDPWEAPQWFVHVEGPVFTVQRWTGPDGTVKLRITHPWRFHKVEVVDATPATWKRIALECAEHQPFGASRLRWFQRWRERLLGAPANPS